MGLFQKLINSFKTIEKVNLEFTTFLSPYYFKGSVPNIGKNLSWKYFEKINGEYVGIIKLLRRKECLGLLDGYCYVKPIKNDRFIIWKRGTTKIELYNSNDLMPIDIQKIDMKSLEGKYYFNAEPIDSIEYFFDLYQTEIDFKFPDSFKEIEEIIQVNEIDGMYKDYEEGIHNTAIVILKQKSNQILLYPQDWFNKSKSIDFGYQWITRAERNKTTDKLHIQGIRIDEYILDKSNRNIEK